MEAIDVAGSLFIGVVCFLALNMVGMPLVPAVTLALVAAATVLGTCRRRRREMPPG